MTRPPLTGRLTAETFEDHYWLKDELTAFCRAKGLSTAGGKPEITARISHYLRTGGKLPPTPRAGAKGTMPDSFTAETVIGPGWRCSQALRAWFEAQTGPGFRFDKAMRDFIADGQGQTLQQALDHWRETRTDDPKEIDGQFEYNRFTRAFRASHPAADHAATVAAWKAWRALPKSQRPAIETL